jgi:hypothetical protein
MARCFYRGCASGKTCQAHSYEKTKKVLRSTAGGFIPQLESIESDRGVGEKRPHFQGEIHFFPLRATRNAR